MRTVFAFVAFDPRADATGAPGAAPGARLAWAAPGAAQPGTPMGLIGPIVIGLIAGAVAKLLMPGRDPGGFVITILLGTAGALVATYLGQAMGLYAAGETAGFVGAVIGALILLLIYRFAFRRART
jgi:uncharacterized membrane protein YeaQ/YmgE (transglycosylase-associated protein family)